ncbi:BMP family ABC transporter substrate-binding protein [Bordetella holmesii]|uniref:Basic membrane protein n=2 Tax=Bordetella holmesii TaxID=35814 RepID=A0A158M7V6_9BORD|nr:BMP family ABC transporter substrate-binding protein [Bordetella holmesii]AIT25149.1 basic membrane family protein [Bordetella holmesii 44057]EWM48810.1 basic membrane family protein [Bordetella holmesii 41130]EWM49836.1 basic membrane family protein [Bordetella holmesii 35009]AMD44384.1 ABC transporter permease [Bordetella holmesii H558]AMD50100.1 ABC transporter permease [Bordetella holmesii F627]
MSARRLLVLFGQRGGFNEAALTGAARAEQAGQRLEVHWIADAQAREHALRALCASSPDLVIVHGGQGDVPVSAVAKDFPGTQFAITQGSHVAGNVASYEILQEHTAFLAGILAALRAGDGAAAHLSGERVRPGLKGRAAYADGVQRISGRDPLTGFCGNQHDPELAGRWGQAMMAQGARVIFAMLDAGRPGLSAACRQAGVWQIGNVVDWVARDPQVFLASALADSGLCVQRAAADHAAARLATGRLTTFGLEHAQALRLVLGPEVSAAERAALDEWSARLSQGRISLAQDYVGPEFSPVSEALSEETPPV